jgi:tRNA A37 methylthiotransferase MiaB
MMTPNLIMPLLDELIEIFESEKIFKFLHLPVQSGDDEVLKKMCRSYTIAEFKEIVNKFRSAFPQVTLSTDIICGFPGESIEAHQNSLKLLEAIKPDIVNISKFFARPKTAAWDMGSIFLDRDVINRRTLEMATLVKKIGLERNQSWINWTGTVFVDEKGKVTESWIGRNFAYKPIVIKSSKNLMGKTLTVKIIKAFSTHLIGSIEQLS